MIAGFDIGLNITLGETCLSDNLSPMFTTGIESTKAVELSLKKYTSASAVICADGSEISHGLLEGEPCLFDPLFISRKAVVLHVFARPHETGDTGQVIDIGYFPDFSGTPRIIYEEQSSSFRDCTYGPQLKTWKWTFGDGSTSSLQNPVHAYMIPGSYDVKLEVWSVNNEYAVVVKEDYIVVKKAAGFVRIKHTCTAKEFLEDSGGKKLPTRAGEIVVVLSGKSLSNLTNMALTGDVNGYENKKSHYKEAAVNGGNMLSSASAANLIYLANTGRTYSGTNSLGAKTDYLVSVCIGDEFVGSLGSGEPLSFKDDNGGLNPSDVTIETVETDGSTISSGVGNAVEFLVVD
jgi:PKD repeat protein